MIVRTSHFTIFTRTSFSGKKKNEIHPNKVHIRQRYANIYSSKRRRKKALTIPAVSYIRYRKCCNVIEKTVDRLCKKNRRQKAL